jgi:hypothetical protein
VGARSWHLKRAEYHKQVAEQLSAQPEYVEWAAVALFYSAYHYIHSALSDEPGLSKEERHPRKHSAPAGEDNQGRGTNQLVRDLYGSIHRDYRSLHEASLRTRYDFNKLTASSYQFLEEQHHQVEKLIRLLHSTRPERREI